MLEISSVDLRIIVSSLGVALFAVLFLQSGIDKLTDWKGNLSWLTGHFENSPLGKIVPLLLGAITITEILAGAICAFGVIEIIVFDQNTAAKMGVILSALNILMLFTGQRLAKDYPGAAVLAGYFSLSLILLLYLA